MNVCLQSVSGRPPKLFEEYDAAGNPAITLRSPDTTPKDHFSDRNLEIPPKSYDRNSAVNYDVSLENNSKAGVHDAGTLAETIAAVRPFVQAPLLAEANGTPAPGTWRAGGAWG